MTSTPQSLRDAIPSADPALSPLQRVEDYVFDRLLTMIARGELLPGARLVVADLTAGFGVSATPVRMAISRLHQVGLVETIPHRGARVARISVGEIHELYEVRRILEGAAARIAACNIDADGIARLEAIWQLFRQAVDADDVHGAYQADVDFFAVFHSFANNKTLLATIHDIHRRLRLYKMLWLSAAIHRKDELQKLKPALLDACRARSAGAAESATRAFLTRAERQLVELVQATMQSP